MAGDWIKLEHATADKPEVLKIAELLGIKRREAVGLLVDFWIWLDKNSRHADVTHMSRMSLDEVTHTPGFAACLHAVGWAEIDDSSGRMTIIHWDRHNGNSAKTRALARDRKVTQRSRDSHATSVTREEKRRVFKELPPISPNDTEPKNETTNPENAVALKTAGFPEPPDWLPADVWKSFREHRARLRAPMTANAGRLLLAELERMRKRGHSPAALLNEAMVRGWKAPVDPEDRDRPGGAKKTQAGRLPF